MDKCFGEKSLDSFKPCKSNLFGSPDCSDKFYNNCATLMVKFGEDERPNMYSLCVPFFYCGMKERDGLTIGPKRYSVVAVACNKPKCFAPKIV